MGEIVERTREDRFEELFREHYGAVRGYALRRAPRDLAQDTVSETFLVAWRRLDDVPADALPWLYGVARRVLANQRRSADRGSALEQRLAATATIAGWNDPGENVGEGETLRTALARLRPAPYWRPWWRSTSSIRTPRGRPSSIGRWRP